MGSNSRRFATSISQQPDQQLGLSSTEVEGSRADMSVVDCKDEVWVQQEACCGPV